MRKIQITNIIESAAPDHPGTVTRSETEICDFHMFTGGYMSGTVAIVEHEDGRISEVPTRLCKFVSEESNIETLFKEACLQLDPATYSGVTDTRVFLNRPEVKKILEKK